MMPFFRGKDWKWGNLKEKTRKEDILFLWSANIDVVTREGRKYFRPLIPYILYLMAAVLGHYKTSAGAAGGVSPGTRPRRRRRRQTSPLLRSRRLGRRAGASHPAAFSPAAQRRRRCVQLWHGVHEQAAFRLAGGVSITERQRYVCGF